MPDPIGHMTQIRGYLSSSDASSAVTYTIYRLTTAGLIEAYTVLATDDLYIETVTIVVGAAMTVTLFDGTDTTVDNGETLEHGVFASNSGLRAEYPSMVRCVRGTVPKIKASAAGAITSTFVGWIVH